MSERQQTVTELLHTLCREGARDRTIVDALYRTVYAELRSIAERLARSEPDDATLCPTELVHEAYLKLVSAPGVDWQGRDHFVAVAATAMRNILVDHARRRATQKRGGGWQRITLSGSNRIAGEGEIEILSLDTALTALARDDERAARVVELRAFAGLAAEDAARILGVSRRTVDKDWNFARAWLARAMKP